MTASVHDLSGARSLTARLEEAGWEPKDRLGKRIWAHPRTGCWYVEEVALEMADRARREGNAVEKGR